MRTRPHIRAREGLTRWNPRGGGGGPSGVHCRLSSSCGGAAQRCQGGVWRPRFRPARRPPLAAPRRVRAHRPLFARTLRGAAPLPLLLLPRLQRVGARARHVPPLGAPTRCPGPPSEEWRGHTSSVEAKCGARGRHTHCRSSPGVDASPLPRATLLPAAHGAPHTRPAAAASVPLLTTLRAAEGHREPLTACLPLSDALLFLARGGCTLCSARRPDCRGCCRPQRQMRLRGTRGLHTFRVPATPTTSSNKSFAREVSLPPLEGWRAWTVAPSRGTWRRTNECLCRAGALARGSSEGAAGQHVGGGCTAALSTTRLAA